MPSDTDLLFGQIAINLGFLTQTEIDGSMILESYVDHSIPLGRHLVDVGLLTEEQHSKVLEVQRKKLREKDPVTKASKEFVLFGRLAVKEGFLGEDQLNECLRIQARESRTETLGEVMVSRGYLTPLEVRQILALQKKRIMSCPSCVMSFTVLSVEGHKTVACPKCKGALREGKSDGSVQTDADFDTKIVRSMKEDASWRASSDTSVRRASPPPRRVKATCKVCQASFEGILDSTQRIRCPFCQTIFVAREQRR